MLPPNRVRCVGGRRHLPAATRPPSKPPLPLLPPLFPPPPSLRGGCCGHLDARGARRMPALACCLWAAPPRLAAAHAARTPGLARTHARTQHSQNFPTLTTCLLCCPMWPWPPPPCGPGPRPNPLTCRGGVARGRGRWVPEADGLVDAGESGALRAHACVCVYASPGRLRGAGRVVRAGCCGAGGCLRVGRRMLRWGVARPTTSGMPNCWGVACPTSPGMPNCWGVVRPTSSGMPNSRAGAQHQTPSAMAHTVPLQSPTPHATRPAGVQPGHRAVRVL